jgi:hypothetical protein
MIKPKPKLGLILIYMAPKLFLNLSHMAFN